MAYIIGTFSPVCLTPCSAENAMEQLATGLNKAAETMATAEAAPETPEAEDEGQEVPDVASLKDLELLQLLEEAYSYKRPRDRQGKSEIFRVSRLLCSKNMRCTVQSVEDQIFNI